VRFRTILSIFGSLIGVLGLSVASRRVVQAARKLRSQPSIHIVGPPGAGKTTLYQYLRHPSQVDEARRTLVRRRTGRIAEDFLENHGSWLRPKIIDDGLGGQTDQWVERLRTHNSEGLIFMVDTHNPDADQAYLQDLYHSYRAFGTPAKRVNLRVLLILLNKFDLWGSTTESREAMMQRYRSEVCQEVVNRFRSTFGITVQFGYASLTRPEHMPYNNLVVREFLAALEHK
jgi:GTPase SAR1 family protein